MTEAIESKDSAIAISGIGVGSLRRELTSFPVLLLTLSCLSPAFSVFGVGADVLQHAGTGAALLFLIGLGVAVVWGLIHAELGSAFPYAGGVYVGVGAILGPWAGFVILTLSAVSMPPAIAFLAKTVSVYVLDLLPNAPADAIVYGALAAALVIALLAVRTSAAITGLFLAVEMIAVLGLMFAGISHPTRSLSSVISDPQMLHAGGTLQRASISALALAGVNAAYATIGGDQAIAFGEELREPQRKMGIVVLTAALIGSLCTALPVIFVVLAATDLVPMLASAAPISYFVSSVIGKAAANALSAAVALAVFNALVVTIMFTGRLFFSLGRDQIFHPFVDRLLATVHPRSGVPRIATWATGMLSAGCCLLASHTLLVITAGSTALGLYLVSASVLVGRKNGQTGRADTWRTPMHPLVPALGLLISTVFLVAALNDEDAGRPSLLFLSAVIAISLLWNHLVLQRRPGGWTPQLVEWSSQSEQRSRPHADRTRS